MKEIKHFPWVFWIRIEVRRDWFSYLWHTRGANFLEIQLWIFRISLGMPWKKEYLAYHLRQNTLQRCIDTNKANTNNKWSMPVGVNQTTL